VRVSAADVNGDGKTEILGESTDVFTVTSTGMPIETPTVEAKPPQVAPDATPEASPLIPSIHYSWEWSLNMKHKTHNMKHS